MVSHSIKSIKKCYKIYKVHNVKIKYLVNY